MCVCVCVCVFESFYMYKNKLISNVLFWTPSQR